MNGDEDDDDDDDSHIYRFRYCSVLHLLTYVMLYYYNKRKKWKLVISNELTINLYIYRNIYLSIY